MKVYIKQSTHDIPERVQDLIEWLKIKQGEVPVQYRESQMLYITGEDSDVELEYSREETEDEKNKREGNLADQRNRHLMALEAQAIKYGKKLVDA